MGEDCHSHYRHRRYRVVPTTAVQRDLYKLRLEWRSVTLQINVYLMVELSRVLQLIYVTARSKVSLDHAGCLVSKTMTSSLPQDGPVLRMK